jgi:hypothetical protein
MRTFEVNVSNALYEKLKMHFRRVYPNMPTAEGIELLLKSLFPDVDKQEKEE